MFCHFLLYSLLVVSMLHAIGYCHNLSESDRLLVSSFFLSEQRHLMGKPRGLIWDQSFLGILLAKQVCGRLLVKPASDVAIEYNGVGRPCTKGVYLSISHCDDLVVVAASLRPIGVDVERIRMDFPDVSNLCTQEEISFLGNPRGKELFARKCCQIWTFKEAYFKSFGSGISHPKSICLFDYQHLVECVSIGQYFITFFIHP